MAVAWDDFEPVDAKDAKPVGPVDWSQFEEAPAVEKSPTLDSVLKSFVKSDRPGQVTGYIPESGVTGKELPMLATPEPTKEAGILRPEQQQQAMAELGAASAGPGAEHAQMVREGLPMTPGESMAATAASRRLTADEVKTLATEIAKQPFIPEGLRGLAAIPALSNRAAGVVAGVERGAAGTAEGAADADNLAWAAAGPEVVPAFTGMMGFQAAKEGLQAQYALATGDTEAAAEHYAAGAGAAGFALLGGKGGAKEPIPADVLNAANKLPVAAAEAIKTIEETEAQPSAAPTQKGGESDAKGIREDTGQPQETGKVVEGGKADSGSNVQQATSETPKPVGEGGQVLLNPEAPKVQDAAGRLQQLKAIENPTPEQIAERDALQAKSDSVKQQMAAEFAKLKQQAAKPPEPTASGAPEKEKALEPEGVGGAVSREFNRPSGSPTGIKNATVDQERIKRGLPPAMEPVRKSFGEVWDRAMAHIDRNPGWIRGTPTRPGLLDELRNKPRALTDEEDAALLHEQINLQNEYQNATRDLAQSYEDGRFDDVEEQRIRVARASDDLLDLYNIGKQVGTETGRGLNARKMMANEDFSLAQMELDKRSANNGKPLTDAQRAEIQQLHDKIAQTQKAYDDYVAATDARIAKLETDAALDRIAREAAQQTPKINPKILEYAEKIVKGFEERGEAAKQRLKARLGRTSAGLDPTILLDVAEVAAEYLSRAALDAAKWTAIAVQELGEEYRPYFEDALKMGQDMVDKQVDKQPAPVRERIKKNRSNAEQQQNVSDAIKTRMDKGEKNGITQLVQKLARTFVEQGIKEREPLIDAVHNVLKQFDPNITRREAMDAISGYGDYKPLTKDAISVELRDLKGQIQQVIKLEDIPLRKPLLKSGVERRTPSDEERRLIQQVNEAKRRFGVVVTDPAKQLKSSLDAIKTNLNNRISDVEWEIANRQKIVRTKTDVPLDQEAIALKERLADLKKQREDIFGKPELTDEQRIKLAENALNKSIAEYNRRIDTGDLTPGKTRSKTPETAKLLEMRAWRQALKEHIQELKDIQNPQKTPEERANQAYKTRTANRIAELESKMANGDYSTKPRTPLKLDAEAMRLKAQNERVKDDWRIGVQRDRLKQRSNFEKLMDATVKWTRFGFLSSPTILIKLTAAVAARMVATPIEELGGAGLSKLPFVRDIAAKAPREGGGLNLRAEVRAWTQGLTLGMKDAYQKLRTGKSDLDVLYGKRDVMPRTWLDFNGNLHGALKAPAIRAEFARSLEKRAAAAAKAGVDITDPLVQTRLQMEAYLDGQRAAFQQRNFISSKWRRFVDSFEEKSRVTGRPTVGGKIAATAGRQSTPITTVPMNIVGEAIMYATGLPKGAVDVYSAIRRGTENLKPEEADLIMRELKKGLVGPALLLAGFFGAANIGGYYEPGKKRKETDVQYGNIRIPGVTVPKFVGGPDVPRSMLHNPALEQLQLGSAVRRVADEKIKKSDLEKAGITTGMFAAMMGLMEETPYVNEMFQLEKFRQPGQRMSAADEMIANRAIPLVVQQIARHYDMDAQGKPIKRDPRTLVQHLEMGIPGLRKNVPEKKK